MLPSLLLVFPLALAAPPEPPGKGPSAPPAREESAPVLRLAPQAKAPARALAYHLLPDPEERKPGNAAILWLRASLSARSVRFKWTEKEWAWASVPLKDLPVKELKALLDQHAETLRLADEAARRDHCDWEYPPLTIQTLQTGLGLAEVQSNRELANLISLRCRLELSERNFEGAVHSLQTGFSLARDVADGRLLIRDLVGLAIAAVMLGRVEEWQQTTGSPNLYWALTALPRPFIDARKSIRYELNTIHRSFPALRDLRKPQSAEQARAVVETVLNSLSGLQRDEMPDWAGKLGLATLTIKYYPSARKALLEAGRPAKEVDAMPALQVVALSLLDSYDSVCDDINKWLSLPPWQTLGPLAQLEKKMRINPGYRDNPLISLLMPALVKVYEAHLRVDRFLATARGAEALRLYASAHGGKPPGTWDAITEVPLPIDPVTGKGLEAFYSVKDGKGVLVVPSPSGSSARQSKHYELEPPGK